jgi:ribosomal-protein-alanine acetyltransferase
MSDYRHSRRVAIQGRLSKPVVRSGQRRLSLRLRRGAERDLDALLALEHSVFSGDRLSRRQFRHHVDARSSDLIVAASAAGVDGYALLFSRSGSLIGRIYSIAVAPSARGQGLGNRLLQRLESIARARGLAEMRLEVRKDNDAAIALYERRGYQRFDERRGYYADGADAWRLSKSLLPRRRRRDRQPR